MPVRILTDAARKKGCSNTLPAYFMTGDTAKAIDTQERAVSLLPPGESPDHNELEANLDRYRQAAKSEAPD